MNTGRFSAALAVVELQPALPMPRDLDALWQQVGIVCAAAMVVTVPVVIWAAFFRKRRHRSHRHHPPPGTHPGGEPALPEASPGRVKANWINSRKRRKKREHRRRNPTLAQTGGLPPIRGDQP